MDILALQQISNPAQTQPGIPSLAGALGAASCRCQLGLQSQPGSPLAPASLGRETGALLAVMQLLLTGLMLGNPQPASAQPPATQSIPSVSESSAVADNPPPPAGKIGQGNKVLVIGDSHTAGTFGDELDKQLRAKGAQVHSVGSSGATADHFLSGKGTTVGFADRKADGSVAKTASHATPRLEELIAQDKPDTIMVALGANFRGAGPGQIQQQVRSLGEIAKKHNIRVIWVGPPTTRQDQSNPGSLQKFDQDMQSAVSAYGEYISSAPHTPKYAGNDGVHYSGAEGSELARKWAQGIAGKV